MEKKDLNFGDLLLKENRSIVPFDPKHKGNILAIHIINGQFIIPKIQACNAKKLHDFKLQIGTEVGKRYPECADISALFYIFYKFRKVNNLFKQLGYPPLKKDRYWTDQMCLAGSHYVFSMQDGCLEYVRTYISSNHPCEEDEGYTNEKAMALLGLRLRDISE